MQSDIDQNNVLLKGITVALVFASVVLAFFDIEAVTNIYMYLVTLLTGDTASPLGVMVVTLVAGLVALSFSIITIEYQSRNAGTPRSIRRLAISLALLGGLFLVGYLGLGGLV